MIGRWVPLDLLRSLVDRTARGGAIGLGGEDPGGHPIRVVPETPLEQLATNLRAKGCTLHDLRTEPRKGRGAAHGTRQITNVTAICWHQAACVLGNPRRYLGVPCHAAVMRNGDVVLLHPLQAYVYHGHAANRFSVGVEIDCRAAGTEGDRRTFWRSKSEKAKGKTYEELVAEATDEQLSSATLLGVYLTEEVARLGGQVVAQMFHRNSHSSRTSDPGSRIALNVAAPLAKHYGHEYGGPVVGSGSTIPDSWRPKT